jgi:DNA-binding transcriptional LysR family regulator
MDLHLVRSFLRAATTGNFTEAAEQLSITQPALSKQINNLEKQIGGRLFDRGRHGAALTPLGRALLQDAAALVAHADDVLMRARRRAAGEEGRLNIGFGMSSLQLAGQAVAEFRHRHPDVTVTLDDMSSAVQVDRLRTGDLHAGFLRRPTGHDLAFRPLQRDRLAVATTGDITRELRHLSRWLDDRPMIRLAQHRGPGLHTQIELLYARHEARPRTLQEAHDLQTVLALVAAGVGDALVPATAAAIAPAPVKVHPLSAPGSSWTIGLAWNDARRVPPLIRFLEIVTDLAEQGNWRA